MSVVLKWTFEDEQGIGPLGPLLGDFHTYDFEIGYSIYPPEPRTRDYPGAPASCELSGVRCTGIDGRQPNGTEAIEVAAWLDRRIDTDKVMRRYLIDMAFDQSAERSQPTDDR